MARLDISTQNKSAYLPGEIIEGKAVWQLDRAADWLEVRLLWFTQGKGDSDISIEDTLRIEQPSLNDSRAFRFQLPLAPYSFSGKLISLIWAIEIVADDVKDAARYEFTLSPDGREIELGTATAHLTAREKAMQAKVESWAARRAAKSGITLPDHKTGAGSSSTSSGNSSGPWSDIK